MQKKIGPMILVIAWGCWFGGLMAVFLFVGMLFHQDRAVAIEAAPRIFHVFEMYQIILAAAAIAAGVACRQVALTLLFILAAVGAVVSPVFITPKIDVLRERHQTQTERFGELHGESMMIYSADSLVLMGAGILLPGAIKKH
ncbi:MAG: hypothetical protein ABSH22_01115 [Tepidisphaeraceae bacterium]|jgi:hypothetical protein